MNTLEADTRAPAGAGRDAARAPVSEFDASLAALRSGLGRLETTLEVLEAEVAGTTVAARAAPSSGPRARENARPERPSLPIGAAGAGTHSRRVRRAHAEQSILLRPSRARRPTRSAPVSARPSPRPAPARHRTGAGLRVAMFGVGALLTADAATTVLWQEPVSALYTWEQQRQLGGELQTVQARLAQGPLAPPRLAGSPVANRLNIYAQRLEHTTHAGQPIGRIKIQSIGASFIVVQGTDLQSLSRGPGHYRGTALPGAPGTAAFAGHRTSFLAPFRRVNDLRPGARIIMTMPYGRFEYSVVGQRLVSPNDVSVLSPRLGPGRLVLTSCDPLFSAARRRVIFASLTRATPRGPAVA